MSGSVRNSVWLVVAALLCLAVVFGLRFAPSVARLGHAGIVVRRPDRLPAAKPLDRASNIAPFATVTVSSEDTSRGQAAEGVADGRPDANEWSVAGDAAGAWLTLAWERPVTVSEIDLYDRPDPAENILSGSLTFDDGSVIAVHALPVRGAPERVTFTPKTIRSVTFRIDQAQGRNPGLGEIMVIGTLN